jgi:catechol 2,3-dioxygenase-like lactoylglutathione lyase family enzyme
MISGISHTNIRLRDLDHSLPVYRVVLGLRVAMEEAGQDASQNAGSSRRAVFLRWDVEPCRNFVVLQSFTVGGDSAELRSADYKAKLSAMGLNHFGLWVDDLDAILARASQAGVQFVRDAVVTCVGRHYGFADLADVPCVRTAQLADPEGNVVQLDEWVGPRGD